MAQTKTKQKSRSSSAKSKSKTASKANRSAKASSAKARSQKPKSPKSNGSVKSNGSARSNGSNGVAAKALMAGGAALIGAAGGVAYGATHSGSKVMGMKMPGSKRVKFRSRDIRKAAKNVGHLGDEVGKFTKELRKSRDDSDGSIGAPVEMLVRTLARHR